MTGEEKPSSFWQLITVVSLSFLAAKFTAFEDNDTLWCIYSETLVLLKQVVLFCNRSTGCFWGLWVHDEAAMVCFCYLHCVYLPKSSTISSIRDSEVTRYISDKQRVGEVTSVDVCPLACPLTGITWVCTDTPGIKKKLLLKALPF